MIQRCAAYAEFEDAITCFLEHGRRPALAGGRYVLVEFSSMDNYRKIHNTIYELVTGGFKPIIAHIERYPAVVSHPEYVAELID